MITDEVTQAVNQDAVGLNRIRTASYKYRCANPAQVTASMMAFLGTGA